MRMLMNNLDPEVAERPDEGTQCPPRLRHPRGTAEPGSHADPTLIPLGELPRRLSELPQGPGAPEIVVHCKMGGRSAKAVRTLTEKGFTRVQNLKGGILEWIDRIDPTQAKY